MRAAAKKPSRCGGSSTGLTAAAIEPNEGRVASGGVVSSVRQIVSAISSSPICRGAPLPRLTQQPIDPVLCKATPPLANRVFVGPDALGDGLVLHPGSRSNAARSALVNSIATASLPIDHILQSPAT
jgi:hypothetical protein